MYADETIIKSMREYDPGYCECDNTHEQNGTFCTHCWLLAYDVIKQDRSENEQG